MHICAYVRIGVDVGARARACVCARVAIVIQHETQMSRIVCGLSRSTKFFDIILQKHDFPEKVTKQKTCVFDLFETFRPLKENSSRYCHTCENVFM